MLLICVMRNVWTTLTECENANHSQQQDCPIPNLLIDCKLGIYVLKLRMFIQIPVFVSLCIYVCMYLFPCVCTWKVEVNVRCVLYYSPPYYIDMKPTNDQAGFSANSRNICFCLFSVETSDVHHHVCFSLLGSRHLNPSHHACETRTLPT